MTFFGNIFYLRPCSVICGPRASRSAANNTTRPAQINNIPSESHVIPLFISFCSSGMLQAVKVKFQEVGNKEQDRDSGEEAEIHVV